MTAPAMPAIIKAGKMTISLLAIGVNNHFHYSRYFSMVPVGPKGIKAFSRGYFELAAAQQPKPKTVAMIAADAEFARTAADGAKRTRSRRSRARSPTTRTATGPSRAPCSRNSRMWSRTILSSSPVPSTRSFCGRTNTRPAR
jgi:hypothetical protein